MPDTYHIIAALTGGTGDTYTGRDLGSFRVTGKAWESAASILNRFRDVEKRPRHTWEERVRNLGLGLWDMLPPEFRAFYWQHVHGNVQNILVSSPEPYIPWELVTPKHPETGEIAPMLGQRFALTRWSRNIDLPNPFEVTDFIVIAPKYAAGRHLAYAQQEAADLMRCFNARRIDPADHEQVMALLAAPNMQVMHFSGHGAFKDTPEDSRIMLADYELDITDLANTSFENTAKPPLIFLNACEVGGQGWALTQIGGRAQRFVEIGSAAFVGPYWTVNDRVAYKEATRFYTSLRNGRTIGAAMQDVRAQFHLDPADRHHPSWLAYSLHCQPNVTVRF